MAQPTLDDLRLYLKNLFEKNEKLFATSKTAAIYLPLLRAQRAAIEALPAALLDTGRPLAEELATIDDQHDRIGRAIFHLAEAYLQHPFADPAAVAAAELTRAQVISALADLRRPYADEAASAIQRAGKLARWKSALKAIPVPGGGTLHDWVVEFTQQGEQLHQLMAERGGAATTPAHGTAAGHLRAQTLGLLNRARDAVRDEAAHLPADFEKRVFGYLDELTSMRAAQGAGRAAAKPAPIPPATAAK